MLFKGKTCKTRKNIHEVSVLFSIVFLSLLTGTQFEVPCSLEIMQNVSIFPVMPRNCYLEKHEPYNDYDGPETETVKIIPPPFRAVFLGCYEYNNKTTRRINPTWKSERMKLLNCFIYCSVLMTSYVALYSGDECYCKQYPLIILKPRKIDNHHCSSPCKGNKRFACGGNGAVALYQLVILRHYKRKRAVSNNSSTRAARTSSPTIISGKGECKQTRRRPNPLWLTEKTAIYLGCYKAVKELNKRTPNQKTFPNISVEACINFCRSLGIQYAVLYGKYCNCGTESLSKYKVADTRCNTGSAKTKRFYLQAYKLNNPQGFDSHRAILIGCYGNNPLKNSMSKLEFFFMNISIDICVEKCQHRGYSFSLISIPDIRSRVFKCNCAQTYFVQGKHSNISNCKIKCPFDYQQFCGGAAPEAYQLHAALPPRGTFSNYGIFLGCFSSLPPGENNRYQFSLSGTNRTGAWRVNTDCYYLDRCVQQCWRRGFHIVAVTSGAICTCVMSDAWETERVGNRLDDVKCNLPCGDASGDYCGGENVYQIYRARILERN